MRTKYKEALEQLLKQVEVAEKEISLIDEDETNAAAMYLISQARKIGAWCCLKINSDYHYVWDVMLVQADETAVSPDTLEAMDLHGVTFVSTDENLLAAVCKVLKFAIEFELKDETVQTEEILNHIFS